MCRERKNAAKLELQLDAVNQRYESLASEGTSTGEELQRAAHELTQTHALLAESKRQNTELQRELEQCRCDSASEKQANQEGMARMVEAEQHARCDPPCKQTGQQ